ncbi:MAG: DUF86 domain-containing protein, partial [bacterium]
MSLKQQDKIRLIKHLKFISDELSDYAMFESLSWEEYRTNRSKRRDVERWIENIVISAIDIAKVILSSEGISLPDTYREIVASLSLVKDFTKKDMIELSKWVRLRNVITHEYLDLKWASINKFISETKPHYQTFLKRTKKYL